MQEFLHDYLLFHHETKMRLLSTFVDKTLSLLRLGRKWFARLLGSLAEAGRTRSYVETVNLSQADTLHQAVKWCDAQLLKREFEKAVKVGLRVLRLGPVKVAIDGTEEPYWGKNGLYNTRAAVHELSMESWQFVNLSVVEPCFIPLMSLPYRQTDDLDELVKELLEYLRSLKLRVKLVLFDRGFYHAELIDYLENKNGGMSWPYLMLVPRTDAVKSYLAQTTGTLGAFQHEMPYTKEKSKWKPTTNIVICKGIGKDRNGKPFDWCFATNQPASIRLVFEYKKRWNIETGFRIQDEAQIKSKSSHPLVRYFYHLLSMLFVLMWRLHNKVKPYSVFKRFVKLVEESSRLGEGLSVKPPS